MVCQRRVGLTRLLYLCALAALCVDTLCAADASSEAEHKRVSEEPGINTPLAASHPRPTVLLPQNHTVDDRLKAAILVGNNSLVKELLALELAERPDVNFDMSTENEAVKTGYMPPGTPIMAAVFASNAEVISALLAHGADGTTGGEANPMTPAEAAAFRADPVSLRALHEGGVDVTKFGPHGFSPLHVVAYSTRPLGKPVKAIGFLAKSADGPRMDVNTRALATEKAWMELHNDTAVIAIAGATPLMEAAKIGKVRRVKALLALGADSKATDVEGWTALHYAVNIRGRDDVAAALLEAGADPLAADKKGRTPADMAADPDVVEGLPPPEDLTEEQRALIGIGAPLVTKREFPSLAKFQTKKKKKRKKMKSLKKKRRKKKQQVAEDEDEDEDKDEL